MSIRVNLSVKTNKSAALDVDTEPDRTRAGWYYFAGNLIGSLARHTRGDVMPPETHGVSPTASVLNCAIDLFL